MQKDKFKKLEKELSAQINDLGNYDPDVDVYKHKLLAIDKEAKVIDTLSKIVQSEEKAEQDKERAAFEMELRTKQFDFEKEKFEFDITKEKHQIELEKEKLELEREQYEAKLANDEAELEIKQRELENKEKNDKKQIIITVVTCAVPAVIGLVTNIIGMRYYNRLAVRALNMEYIDNAITPRSYNECLQNINKFMSKK